MSTIDFTTPALQLTATLDGHVKVHIDDSTTSGYFASSGLLAGCNHSTIKSVSLLVAQKIAPFNVYSNTLNGFEDCTYSYDNVSRIISEVATLTVVPKYADYNVTLTLNYGELSKSVSGSVSVLGDPITPTISAPITPGATPGSTLKLKLSPNSFEGRPAILTANISKVIIFKDGVALPEVTYAPDGFYPLSDLVANATYSFAVQMKTTQGFVSDVSPSVTGTPVKTYSPIGGVVGSSGTDGDYFIEVPAESRLKRSTGTDAEILADQLKEIQVYAYVHPANEIEADASTTIVADASFNLIHTIKASVDPLTGTSSIPLTTVNIQGAYNGRYIRIHSRSTNGYGQGASVAGTHFRVLPGSVSAPTVSYSLLGSNTYQISVRPGAPIVGYTLTSYKVTSFTTGTFSGSDILKTHPASNSAYLRAIEKVTSSGVLGKTDTVSLKEVSTVTFALPSPTVLASFDIQAEGIYELTHELAQVKLPIVLGSDLKLNSTYDKLVYDKITLTSSELNIVFANLAGDLVSEVTLKEKLPVLAVADWAPLPAAAFVSASGDKATFKISIAKYTPTVLTNQVKYTILTAKQAHQELASPFFVEHLSFTGLSANIEVSRGERTLVQVRVSEFDGLNMVAQSVVTQITTALTVAGQGAYSGLDIMSYAHQEVGTFATTDKRSLFNAAVTGTGNKARIALESSGLKDAHMVFNSLIESQWSKATKIYLLGANGTKTEESVSSAPKQFGARSFDMFTLTGLDAMKSYSYEIHRHWVKGQETLYDAAPITVTVVPTIAVQKRNVKFFTADSVVDSIFELTTATESNGEAQLKAIKAQGGILNAVLIKNADGSYSQVEQSSSARFTSVVTQKGIHFLASCAQYRNPNFGANYSQDAEYIKSAQTDDVHVYFGAVPETLSPVTVTSDKDGCLVSWPVLAAGRTVDVYAIFDDATFANKDSWALLSQDVSTNKALISHASLMSEFGLTHTQYHNLGLTFLVVQKDATGASLPAAKFHIPKGQTDFKFDDFTVSSGAKQLTIKYKVIDEEEVNKDFAGNKLIPATITYTHSSTVVATLKVADITSANGVVIGSLDDTKTYIISVAIDGQASALSLGSYSPAAAPIAVAELKVENAGATALNVSFAASASIKNGEYSSSTVAYKAYVYTLSADGSKQYVSGFMGEPKTVAGFALSGLTAGALYTVEIESIFAAVGANTEQKVYASASATPCAAPVIKDFRLDTKNREARLIVDLQGAKLNTLLLLASSGSVLNIDLKNAAVAQSKLGQIALNIAVPAGITNVAAIVANSQGLAMNAANSAQGDAQTKVSNDIYNAVTAWVNL